MKFISHKRVILICLVFVLLFSSPAFCRPEKVDLTPSPNLSIESSGHILFNYIKHRSRNIIHIDCWNLESNEKYSVWFQDGSDNYTFIGYFSTNSNGCGSGNYIRFWKLKNIKIFVLSGDQDSFDQEKIMLYGEKL